jgi:hypothetical protein
MQWLPQIQALQSKPYTSGDIGGPRMPYMNMNSLLLWGALHTHPIRPCPCLPWCTHPSQPIPSAHSSAGVQYLCKASVTSLCTHACSAGFASPACFCLRESSSPARFCLSESSSMQLDSSRPAMQLALVEARRHRRHPPASRLVWAHRQRIHQSCRQDERTHNIHIRTHTHMKSASTQLCQAVVRSVAPQCRPYPLKCENIKNPCSANIRTTVNNLD